MKKILFAVMGPFMALSLALTITPSANADPGLCALWHFDEDAQATTISDSSGNGHTGTIFGAIPGQAGMFGKAMFFDGVDDFVGLGSSNGILNTNTFTIEAWFNTSENHPVYGASEGRLVNLHWQDGACSTAVSLYLEQDKVGLLYHRGGMVHVWVKKDTTYWDSVWHHIAVTRDGTGSYTFYYDGAKVEPAWSDLFGGFGAWPAYMGTYDPGPPSSCASSASRFFHGYLDEVRIYDYALSLDDIESHFNGVYYNCVIDIKPGSDRNVINIDANGVIPVAIMTTSVADGDPLDFDAADVDPSTVLLDGAAVRMRGKAGANVLAHLEDVDGDGDLDLVVQVENETTLASGATIATLTGKTWGGLGFVGTDSVVINEIPE